MASAGSLHLQVDVNHDEVRDKVKARKYQPASSSKVLNQTSRVFKEWPTPPHNDHLQVFVALPSVLSSPSLAHDVGMTKSCEWFFSSSFWAKFLVNLIMFLLGSVPSDALRMYNSAKKLYEAMWNKDLNGRLADVDDLKYLPTTQVEILELRQLGCSAKAILVRKEYSFTMNALEERQKAQGDSGGIVVTGHPGIGTPFITEG